MYLWTPYPATWHDPLSHTATIITTITTTTTTTTTESIFSSTTSTERHLPNSDCPPPVPTEVLIPVDGGLLMKAWRDDSCVDICVHCTTDAVYPSVIIAAIVPVESNKQQAN